MARGCRRLIQEGVDSRTLAKMIQDGVNFACQAWFGLCLTVGMVLNWVGCMTFTALLPVSQAQAMCCKWCHNIFLWFLIKASPWIRVSPPSAEDFDRLLGREGVCLLMNHTSFYDSVLFVGITPPHIIWRYRTLMANYLFDVSVTYSCLELIMRKAYLRLTYPRPEVCIQWVLPKSARASRYSREKQNPRVCKVRCVLKYTRVNYPGI